jgi:hypothetical protein
MVFLGGVNVFAGKVLVWLTQDTVSEESQLCSYDRIVDNLCAASCTISIFCTFKSIRTLYDMPNFVESIQSFVYVVLGLEWFPQSELNISV